MFAGLYVEGLKWQRVEVRVIQDGRPVATGTFSPIPYETHVNEKFCTDECTSAQVRVSR